jgi:hypothetical protein
MFLDKLGMTAGVEEIDKVLLHEQKQVKILCKRRIEMTS